ncbi:MAG: hypothetical protein IJA61_01880 [Clostridia bacterium]|nr:hypothetical protein [Clostridia bacterium]
MEFEYGISLEEAAKRTEDGYLTHINLLNQNSPEYKELTQEEKKVIYHLCRAGYWIEKISYMLENKDNLAFYNYVKSRALQGEEYSQNILRLFVAQKGMNSLDSNGDQIHLAKGYEDKLGLNFYQFNMSVDNFHKNLIDMLDNGEIDEVKKILSCRTVVKYDGKKLYAVDYVDEYKEDFLKAANELDLAASICSDTSFKEYLLAQSTAFKEADTKLDAKADMLWAKLKDSRLEFTVTRENYEDDLTTTVFDNPELVARLNKYAIEAVPKDSLGTRIGVVNKEGTKLLDTLSTLNDIASKLMPYNNEYSNDGEIDNINQVAVDIDLIALTGNEGAYRASIVLAQNLPNSDKLATKLGGGRRNCYHRQIRTTKSSNLNEILISKEYLQYFNLDAMHWATIEHENTHSLGPKNIKDLGAYASILEEYKADMGIYAFLNDYKEAGIFTDQQTKEIIVTELFGSFAKAKPQLSQAHRVRSVMIVNRMFEDGGMDFVNKQLTFNFDRVIEISKTMLAEVVRLQLDRSAAKAKQYVEKYFVWTDRLETIANIIREHSKKLNGELVRPIFDEATHDLTMV